MSKSNDQVLLLPGEKGWEIWAGPSPTELSLHQATEAERAGDVENLPAGDLLHFFPVKSITAIPMRVASDDEALFPDLAAMHSERLGLRADPMAGQLTDVFTVSREPENSALVSVLLRVPGEGEMPTRGPKGFDISARAFALPGETLALWKEIGRWVFALSYQGNFTYCQATSIESDAPDDALAREIRLAMIQLAIQGIEIKPTRLTVWTNNPSLDTDTIGRAFGIPVESGPRPTPVIPSPLSKLLPADVRAARKAAQKRRNILLGAAALAAVYVGLLGWYGYGLWRDHSETKRLIQAAEAMAPEAALYSEHIARWDELADAIERANSPVDILSRVASSIPPNSGLRLKTAEITSKEITIIGEAPQLPAVNTFSLNLNNSNSLAAFKWQTPEPNQSTRGWEFVFNAEIPVETQQ